MPASAALVATLRARGIAAVISGAGPTVLALTDAGTADKFLAEAASDGSAWAAHRLELDLDGACVLPLTGSQGAPSVGSQAAPPEG